MFNDFFSTVGQKIHDNVHNLESKSFESFLQGSVVESLFFSPITISDIINIVSKFDENKSAGYDDINIRIVKSAIFAIVNPLCNIFNFSLEKGIFPSALKIAKVIPVYKTGNKTLVNNYRPVSILSIFSKLFEKLVYDKLICFIDKHNPITISDIINIVSNLM